MLDARHFYQSLGSLVAVIGCPGPFAPCRVTNVVIPETHNAPKSDSDTVGHFLAPAVRTSTCTGETLLSFNFSHHPNTTADFHIANTDQFSTAG